MDRQSTYSDNENQSDPYDTTPYEEQVPYLPSSRVEESVEARPSSSSVLASINPPMPVAKRSPGRPLSGKILIVILLIGFIALSVYTGITLSNRMALSQRQSAATSTAVANTLNANKQATGQAATTIVQTTATAYASQNPYPLYTQPFLNDPLTMNTAKANWGVGNIGVHNGQVDGTCAFTPAGYDLTMRYVLSPGGTAYFGICRARQITLSDFVFQVQMKVISGNCGGLAFRHSETLDRDDFYYVTVCQDGNYRLYRFSKEMPSDQQNLRLAAGTSAAIKKGPDQVNQVAIVAHGDTFDLYMNRQHIASAQNTEYAQGSIGMIVMPQEGVQTEVLYSDAQVWTPAV